MADQMHVIGPHEQEVETQQVVVSLTLITVFHVPFCVLFVCLCCFLSAISLVSMFLTAFLLADGYSMPSVTVGSFNTGPVVLRDAMQEVRVLIYLNLSMSLEVLTVGILSDEYRRWWRRAVASVR